MTECRRRLTSDVWHWMPNCRWWPEMTLGAKRIWMPEGERPGTGELCNECQAKERNQ